MQVLRVVTLGSSTGRYGGPFDTAIAQARLISTLHDGVSMVIMCGHLEGDSPSRPDAPGLVSRRVRRLLPLPGFAGLGSVRMFAELWRGTSHADVVHVSISRELIPAVAAVFAAVRGRRLVLQPHGMITARTSRAHRAFDLLLRPLARKASVVLALTEVEARQLREWFGHRCPPITVVGNPTQVGGDALGGLRQTPKTRDAVWIARLHPRKMLATLLDAAREAEERAWGDTYTVYGPDEGDLNLLDHQSGAPANVAYDGVLRGDQVPAEVARSRVFVLTAREEPWGNVLVTALALGVPVVVSASTALAPLIAHHGAGAVVPDEDARGFARAVHELLSSQSVWSAASEGALQLASVRLLGRSVSLRLMSAYTGRDEPVEGGAYPS